MNIECKKFIKENIPSRCSGFIKDYLNYKYNYTYNLLNENFDLFDSKLRRTKLSVNYKKEEYNMNFEIDLLMSKNSNINDKIKLKRDLILNSSRLKTEFEKFDGYLKSINDELSFSYVRYDGIISDVLEIKYKYNTVLCIKCNDTLFNISTGEILSYLKSATFDFVKYNSINYKPTISKLLEEINKKIKFINYTKYYTYKSKRKHGDGFRWINNNCSVKVFLYYKLISYSPSNHVIELIENNRYKEVLYSRMVKVNEIIDTEELLMIALQLLESNMRWNCKECKDEFNIESKELRFFIEKDFDLPKRCKSCRQKRKQNK